MHNFGVPGRASLVEKAAGTAFSLAVETAIVNKVERVTLHACLGG